MLKEGSPQISHPPSVPSLQPSLPHSHTLWPVSAAPSYPRRPELSKAVCCEFKTETLQTAQNQSELSRLCGDQRGRNTSCHDVSELVCVYVRCRISPPFCLWPVITAPGLLVWKKNRKKQAIYHRFLCVVARVAASTHVSLWLFECVHASVGALPTLTV